VLIVGAKTFAKPAINHKSRSKKIMGKKAKIVLIGLLATVTGVGAAFGIVAQTTRGNDSDRKDEKATYRSSVQVQDDPNEREETNEANETSEENEADEQGEKGEKAEANEADEANEAAETDAEDQAENAESARLQSLARITPEQAKSAALAQVSGTLKKVELENEDGNVVYGVEIQTADGGDRDVKVDAGNGQVLHTETGEENDGEND
jgi:uncharacterized membrane protein YkoI